MLQIFNIISELKIHLFFLMKISALFFDHQISHALIFQQRDAVSQATSGAPRRLLQFAVRDAVRTLRPSGSVKEPSRKRLRSVVSASTEDTSLVDRPRRLQSIARVPNPMATVLKAVREAAEDVVKVKSSGSVFDRLGRDMDASLITEQVAEFRDHAVEDDEYEDFNEIQEQTHSNYPRRSKHCGRAGTTNMTGHEAGLTTGLMSDYEVYDDSSPVGHRVMDVSQTGTYLGSKGKDSLMSNYNVAKDQDQSVSAANTSRKIVNISVNVNTWRPPHYQESRDTVMDNLKSVQDNEADAGSFGAQLMKEISNPVSVSNGNVRQSCLSGFIIILAIFHMKLLIILSLH
jgi:Ni,Fe-hydrogenase I large subunit